MCTLFNPLMRLKTFFTFEDNFFFFFSFYGGGGGGGGGGGVCVCEWFC